MSTLVIQLPEHRRLRARATDEAAPDPGRRREYVYVTSADGIEFEAQGEAAAALLPRASQVIAVVARDRRQLASHHPAQGAGVAAARRAGRRDRGRLARGRGDGPPRGRAAGRRRRADLGRRRRPRLAARTSSTRCRRPASSSTGSCRWPGPTSRRSGHFHVPAVGRSPRSPGGTVLTWAACRRRRHRPPRRRPGARPGAAAAAGDDPLDRLAHRRRRRRAVAGRAGRW